MKKVRLLRRLTGPASAALVALAALYANTPAPVAQIGHAPASTAVISGAPHAGGSIVVRLRSAPDCLDPQKTASDASYTVIQAIVDTLVSMDDRDRIRPNLAMSWDYGHGNTWLTFHLYRDVRFSNGDPLDAGAVAFTFARAVDPTTKSPVSASLLDGVKGVQVLDRYTVRLILRAPQRTLLPNLASAYAGILDPRAVKRAGDASCRFPIGSGPFMVEDIGPGFSTVTLARNPRYHRAPPWAYHQGPAYLSTVVFKSIASDATATSALLTGGIDISNVAGDQLMRVKDAPTLTFQTVREQGEYYLGFNTARRPFDTVEARRAVAQAVDKRALIAVAAAGRAVPDEGALPSSVPYYDPSAARYAPRYDPVAARRYAGAHPLARPVTLLAPADPERTAAAEYIQAQLGQVGLAVTIVTQASRGVLGSNLAGGHYDLALLSWVYPDPDILYLLFHSSQEVGGGSNFTFYHNAALDQALAEGRVATNATEARRVYADAQRIIAANALIVPLFTNVTTYAVNKRVHGLHPTPQGPLTTLFQDLWAP